MGSRAAQVCYACATLRVFMRCDLMGPQIFALIETHLREILTNATIQSVMTQTSTALGILVYGSRDVNRVSRIAKPVDEVLLGTANEALVVVRIPLAFGLVA